MKSITIICPLYNAEKYIDGLHCSIKRQKQVNIKEIKYLLTESNDHTEQYLKINHIQYKKIQKKDFSHSLTREEAALESKSDIIVFITQDIIIEDELWLYYLTKDITHKVVASYSRQISKYNNIEKYTRENNYKEKSIIKNKDSIQQLGLNTFFFSDASSAIDLNIFKKLNGYDHKDLPTNEDMYFAYKLIMNGYQIKYAADSIIYHSHNFTLKDLYNRYYLTGLFFKEHKYLNNYKTNESGMQLAKYVLKRSLQDKNIKVLIRFILDMAVRLIAMKKAMKG